MSKINHQTEYWQYLEHYQTHTWYICMAWLDIENLLLSNELITNEEAKQINQQIIWHDNSKIDNEEFYPYAAKFYRKDIDAPEKETIKVNFKIASSRHKSLNLHHWQTLKDYQGSDWKCYIVEMVCDYIAMGWEFNDPAYDYYEREKTNIDLPDLYRSFLETILELLKQRDLASTPEPLAKKFARLW